LLFFGFRDLFARAKSKAATASASLAISKMAQTGEDGLAVQDLTKLDPSTLTPLTPEVISRQVPNCARMLRRHAALLRLASLFIICLASPIMF
jgi:hypothetical protein